MGWLIQQAPVIQIVDSAIGWINLYPVDNTIGFPNTRVSMGWWLLRLSGKISALLRLPVKFFQLRLTKK